MTAERRLGQQLIRIEAMNADADGASTYVEL
jgi:hypothetical protein